MGKKKSSGGIGSLIFKIVKIAVFIFLLANFCWNGKPLWKNIIPTAGSTIEKSEKTIKKEAEKVQKAVKEASYHPGTWFQGSWWLGSDDDYLRCC